MQSDAKANSPSGAFLANSADAPQMLGLAATLPLDEQVLSALQRRNSEPKEIARAFLKEEESNGGFWRVALAALAYARRHAKQLPEVPSEFESAISDALSRADKRLIGNEQFSKYAFDAMAQYENFMQSRTRESDDVVDNVLNPMEVVQGGGTLNIKLRSTGSPMLSASFILLGDQKQEILKRDFLLEDLVFIALTALRTARVSFESAKGLLSTEHAAHLKASSSLIWSQVAELQKEMSRAEALFSPHAQSHDAAGEPPID